MWAKNPEKPANQPTGEDVEQGDAATLHRVASRLESALDLAGDLSYTADASLLRQEIRRALTTARALRKAAA